jgi:hypothetical protein
MLALKLKAGQGEPEHEGELDEDPICVREPNVESKEKIQKEQNSG